MWKPRRISSSAALIGAAIGATLSMRGEDCHTSVVTEAPTPESGVAFTTRVIRENKRAELEAWNKAVDERKRLKKGRA